MSVRRVFREPLLHFLIAGGVLFGIFALTPRAKQEMASDKTIKVDNETLLTFLQYRSKAFEPEYFAQQLEALSPEERQNLVDQYIEEEMLYREAVALGLEQGDYVIRQRLVQKMKFLMDDLTEGGPRPTDAVLNAFLEKNRNLYALDPSVTFTHVFLDASIHGQKAAMEMAERLKNELNARGAGFNDAPQFGDRFPFLQNYVERTSDYVGSHFGPEFMSDIAKIAPSEKRWSGPIRSMYGYHVVLLTARTPARVPELAEVRSQVEEDWLRDRSESARTQGLNRLASEYTIDKSGLNLEGLK